MNKKNVLSLVLIAALCVGVFSGCGLKKANKEEEEVTLRWYARINKESDNKEIFEKANTIVKEKLGFNLDLIALEDYHTKISVINASGEDFDIVYTSSVVNNIYQNVADENLLALDELLPKYAPKLWKDIDADVWAGVKIAGKIYGVPNQQIFARGPGFMIPAQNVNLLGLDLESMANYTIDDYEKYLRIMKEKIGTYAYVPHIWGGGGYQLLGFESILGSNLPGMVRFREKNSPIVNQYESEEYKHYIKTRAKWVAEGLASPMEVKETDIAQYVESADKVIPWLSFMNTYIPGVEKNFKANYGIDVVVSTKSEPLLNGYGLLSTMAAVNSDTRYPEQSVQFLEFLNTDKDFYNLIVYGTEGYNYKKLNDNHIKLSSEHPYTQPAWAIGNTFNGYLLEGQADDLHDQTKAINRRAMRSPILGFAPNFEEIKFEVASCKAVIDEFSSILDQGLVDVDTTYTAFIEKLKAAGVDELIRKLNVQLDNWRNQQ